MTKYDITFCPSHSSRTQISLFADVADGCYKAGVKAAITTNQPKTKNVACWGWRKGQQLRAEGHNVLVFERAYLGDRFSWTSIAWNGLNGRGDFCLPKEIKPERFTNNFSLKPWKKDGDIIVIMGQLRGDMSLRGIDLTAFYEKKAAELEALYRKKVFFRPHPARPEANFRPNIPVIDGNLEDVLTASFLVVTYNSNSGVDAVVSGIPALSFDKGSMAYNVTGHSVRDRITPEREHWAYKLAHCQWTPEEIKNGDYWDRFRCKLVS